MDFKEFSKIPRLSRECVITEKIDGTNGVIYIGEDGEFLIGSRSRWIQPVNDNYGFAKWATDHKEELLGLGKGFHYGEWWGSGIQRGYGLPKGEKRFSLFNVGRWCLHNSEPKRIPNPDPKIEKYRERLPACCSLVPILWEGIFDTVAIEQVLTTLKITGSEASPGFKNPEGIVIFHKAGNVMFKKTILKDDVPKGSHESR